MQNTKPLFYHVGLYAHDLMKQSQHLRTLHRAFEHLRTELLPYQQDFK